MKKIILAVSLVLIAGVSNAIATVIDIPEDTIILHWENHCPIDQVETYGYSVPLEATVLSTITCGGVKYFDVSYIYGNETHYVAVNANDVPILHP